VLQQLEKVLEILKTSNLFEMSNKLKILPTIILQLIHNELLYTRATNTWIKLILRFNLFFFSMLFNLKNIKNKTIKNQSFNFHNKPKSPSEKLENENTDLPNLCCVL